MRAPDFISPSKAPETPHPNKVKSLGLETGACQACEAQALVLGPLRTVNLWVILGMVFWEPLKLLVKGYVPIHLSGEVSELSLDSQRLKDSKKVKNH